jgi:hypothetical protein
MEPDDSLLTKQAKDEIRKYMLRIITPFAAILSVITFFIGFFAKDVAVQMAEAEFIKAQYASAVSAAMAADHAVTSANTTLSAANDLSTRIKTQSAEIAAMLGKSNTALAEAQDIKKTIDTSRALQDADNVLKTAKQAAADYIDQLDKSGQLSSQFDTKIGNAVQEIGTLQRAVDALPFRQFQISPPIDFSNQGTIVPVPGYSDAKFCALTKVQIVTLSGACQLWKDPTKGWMMAATTSQRQTCELICVK